MQRVLVTGGAGFMGSNFIRCILKADPAVLVVNLDALTYAGSIENLKNLPDPERHTFVRGNICDGNLVADILRTFYIDTIVHFAAESHVDRSIYGPERFVRTNVLGTQILLEQARNYWLGDRQPKGASVRFHHISTDEIHGSLAPDDPPWTEHSSYDPHSPYAASKAAADHLVRAYGRTYGLPFTLTNSSNNYGPFQFPEKLIPLTILNALEGRDIPVYGDGGQIRDWLYVEDHCEGVRLVLERGTAGESYNLAGGNQPTNLEVVESICCILDKMVPDSPHIPHGGLVRHVGDRPGHDRRYAMNAEKITATLGWHPRWSLEEGLKQTVHWYLEQPAWVTAVNIGSEYRRWLKLNYAKRDV
jgi:dTDP-glucose 4,6-dehydratase